MPWELPSLPVTRVEVELTEACNLRCSFCYNSCAPKNIKQVKTVLHRLHEAGVMEIILTGGEPSLFPNFSETLQLAADLFPRVMVQSNGTLFNSEEQFGLLRSVPIFCLNFSLHGPESVHDRLTQKDGSCKKTLEALKLANKYGIRTASNLVLNTLNAKPDILDQTVELLNKTGCKEMTVTRFIPTGTGKLKPLSISHLCFIDSLRLLVKTAQDKAIALLLANAVPSCELPEDLQHLCNRCSFGFDKFYVDVEGNLLVCGMSRKILGNIINSPLKDVLKKSELYSQYRKMQHIPLLCKECANLETCGGGCRAAALAKTGTLTGQDSLIERTN